MNCALAEERLAIKDKTIETLNEELLRKKQRVKKLKQLKEQITQEKDELLTENKKMHYQQQTA